MIGSLRGHLAGRSVRGEAVVEVAGVGYRVAVAPRTLAGLGPVGAEVLVHTHLYVREDALSLFGFATAEERDCFEVLIGARGVGAVLALAILSVHTPAELRRAVAGADLDALSLVPGVGRKTAARLVIELKSRLDVPGPAEVPAGFTNRDANGSGVRADLRAALATLGYGPDEVSAVLRDLPPEGELEELLRTALRLLAASR